MALDRISIGDVGSSLAARCKTHVREAAAEFVRSEGDATRAAVVTEKARAAQAESGERASVTKAFEKLVLRHTLPEATFATHLRGRGATHYDAHLRGKTAYGLEWAVALEIPSSHLLAHILRIDRVIERLEIDAPEEAGWIHKETKMCIRDSVQRGDARIVRQRPMRRHRHQAIVTGGGRHAQA